MKPALTVLILLMSACAVAQTTYRWVDPATGRTMFSDQPPPPGTTRVEKKAGAEPSGDKQQTYAAKLAAEKFPVVLYTAADCLEPCKQGRDLLNLRGVPFQEKMVQAGAPEAEELKQLIGNELSVPVIVVGRQKYKGFETAAWNNLLDISGYPKPSGSPRPQ